MCREKQTMSEIMYHLTEKAAEIALERLSKDLWVSKDVREALCVGRVLSETQIQEVNTYLANKWGGRFALTRNNIKE